MVLRTDRQYREALSHDDVNQIASAVNVNTDASGANASQIAQVSSTVSTTQSLVVQNQQGVADVKTSQTSTATTIAALQTALTVAENAITALEAGSPPAVSNPPTLGAPTTITTTSMQVPFTAPSSGPTPTSYVFQYAVVAAGSTGVFGPTPGQSVSVSPAAITGLAPGTTYAVHAASVNAVGPGALSNEVRAATTTSFTPSPAWSNIPAISPLVMDDGGLVTLVAGVVQLNGSPMGLSSSVDLVVKADTGRIFQRSRDPSLGPDGGWWYWDPTQSYPWVASGDPRPVIPGNSTPRQQMITYLQSISGNHVLSGQTTHNSMAEYNGDISATGIAPAIAWFDPYLDQWANNYYYDPNCVTPALAHAAAGGIVGVAPDWPNPAGGGGSQDGNVVSATQILTPGTAQYNTFMGFVANVADAILVPLKNAGIAVLYRDLWELDGGWFWWGDVNQGRFGQFNGAQQNALRRQIKTYFDSRGLDNLIYVFAVNGGPGSYTVFDSDLFDIIGVDAYTDSLAAVYTTVYNTLRAQAPSKLIALTEWGSGTPTGGGDPSYNVPTLFSELASNFPRVCYVNAWTASWAWSQQSNAAAGLSSSRVINRSGVILP